MIMAMNLLQTTVGYKISSRVKALEDLAIEELNRIAEKAAEERRKPDAYLTYIMIGASEDFYDAHAARIILSYRNGKN